MVKANANAGLFGASLGQTIRFGFGVGLGSYIALILLMLVAALFFVPGFLLVMRERKKTKEARSTGMLTLGYILMGIGMIVGIGFGAGTFLQLLGGEF